VPWHGISRLPAPAGEKPATKQVKPYLLGYCHRARAEVRTEAGQRSLFVAIDRAGKFAAAELPREASKTVAAPCTAPPHRRRARQRNQDAFHHRLERVCRDESLDPRLTKTHHPWTNGQGERLNRPRKEATMQKYDDQTPQHIRAHLQAFLMADNFAKRRKPLKGRTPSEYICQCWHTEPERFRINPHHHTLGLNT
jgi:hypothetical protein